ncbi:sugar kinase [Vibrio sp. SS-MA-C1-2]|uniref:sugar kinase n=1 Tax=Vibrio sp. SS-MA-C1-2 TaxID=2908646 RepID=UPI001F2E68D7|nr:sugar kinase [Vibrio sp. SS-MA-C1-2]UJF17710.1 sugar kinase [Vibrio sp. SS-MA-C1-2]
MKKVGFIGECMIELNGQAFGEMKQHFGGDTLNSAVYLHRLDPTIKPYYITAVGNDELSQQLVSLWQQEGIDTSLTLLDQHHQTGLYQISLDVEGERTFSYWRKQSAASQLLQHPDFSNVKKALFELDYLYLSGISVAIFSNSDKLLFVELLKSLHQAGVKIVFDSNYRAKLWDSPQQAQFFYQQIIPLCEYALITFDDEIELWGDKKITDATERLQKLGLNKFVLKLGAGGCQYFSVIKEGNQNRLQSMDFPTDKVSHVVDTTSAGDSFNAGFICQLLRENSPEKGCQLGNQLAGLVIQHKGAIIPQSVTDTVKLSD